MKIVSEITNEHAKWVSVNERLPKEGEIVLAFSPQDGVNIARCVGNQECDIKALLVRRWDMKHPERATHWMALPAPPEVQL